MSKRDWIIQKFNITYIFNPKQAEVTLSKGAKSRGTNHMNKVPLILPYDMSETQ